MNAMRDIVHKRETCRGCGSDRIVLSVPLAKVPVISPNVGDVPDAGRDAQEVVAPLDNYLCLDCGLIQLLHVVDPSLIYRNYLYRTAVSLGLARHFAGLAQSVRERVALSGDDLVVEFGSNDGTLLAEFKKAGLRVCGVDPAREIAREATARGIPTRADFFGVELAQKILAELGPAKAIVCNNVLANIDNLADIFQGVKRLLAPEGCFVFETQYALDVFDKFLLDVIYHEHISCFSVKPLEIILPRFGLQLVRAERIPTKGGSIRIWVQHAGGPIPRDPAVQELVDLEIRSGLYDLDKHRAFSERVSQNKGKLHDLILAEQAKGSKVAGFGTSVGCAALIHQFELEDKLEALFDDQPFKRNLEGPGYHLPVYRGDALDSVDYGLVVILAWRYASEIMRRHSAYLEKGGRAVVVLPDIVVLKKSSEEMP